MTELHKKYRLTSTEKPTGEMLQALMEDVAIAARESNAKRHMRALEKVLIVILLCCICSGRIYAQYVPKEGEKIAFLPVADKIRETVSGFDCFYDGNKCEKNGKYSFKKKCRLNPNSQLLTSLSEIEGHEFKVLSQMNYIPKKSQYGYYMLVLERDDKKKVVLRIPFMPESEENILTHSMRYHDGAPNISTTNSIRNVYGVVIPPYSVSIPCYNVDEYRKMLDLMHRNVVVSYNPQDRNPAEYNICNNRLYDICIDLNKEAVINDLQKGCSFTINDIFFKNIDKYNYKQILVSCERKNRKVLLPAFVYRSKGNNVEFVIPNSSYSFFDFFRDEEWEIEHSLEYDKNNLNKYLGVSLYYGFGKKYKSLDFEEAETNSLYKLEEGWYRCVSFRYEKTSKATGVHAILEDSKGVRFMIPFSYREYIDKTKFFTQSCNFDECFMLEDQEKLKRQELYDKQKKEQDELTYIATKYGKKYADELQTFPYGREKFLKMVKKYNAPTALQMVNKQVRIGWTYQMVRDSKGEPDEIQTSEYTHSYNELWVYGNSFKTYLYFVNGKLNNITTIGDVK